MSAGRFVSSRYESNNGDIYPIRVQPETIEAPNVPPADPVSMPVSANVTRRRGNGMFCRGISLKWAGEPPVAPAGYDPNGRIRIPILTEALFDSISVDDSFTYLGQTATVTGLLPELRR